MLQIAAAVSVFAIVLLVPLAGASTAGQTCYYVDHESGVYAEACTPPGV